MKKDKLIDKKTLATVSAGVVLAYALSTIVFLMIATLQYDTQDYYTKDALKRAAVKLKEAETHQDYTYENIAQKSYDTLHTDPQFQHMVNHATQIAEKIYALPDNDKKQRMKLAKQYENITNQIAEREFNLRREYINKHPDMIRANARLNNIQKHYTSVAKECAIRDSIEKLPKWQRLKANWNKIREDRQLIKSK